MDLTEDEVNKILKLVDELDYGEIHLTIGALRIDLVKTPPNQAARAASPSAAAVPTPQPVARGTSEPAHLLAPEEPLNLPDGTHIVVAPVAGTFYSAPSPGATPFVEVGAQVDAEDPIGLLEVMKLFNSVPAGVRGTVLRMLVADATVVTKGQALIAIEPDRAS